MMPRHPSDRRVARFIEERAKALSGRELDDSLVSAIDAAERPDAAGSAGFLPLMLGDAVRKLRAIEPAEILTPSELRRGALRAACGTGLLLIALVASAPFFERAATTARLRFFQESVRIEVHPRKCPHPNGHVAPYSRIATRFARRVEAVYSRADGDSERRASYCGNGDRRRRVRAHDWFR